MKEITVQELKQLIDEKKDFQLIDVREEYEFDEVNIKGDLIPMGEVMENVEKISKDKTWRVRLACITLFPSLL